MKRDLDLIRTLLLAAEAKAEGQFTLTRSDAPGSSNAKFNEHTMMTVEGGLLRGEIKAEHHACQVYGIGWAGHEFLAATRDPSNWGKIKDRLTNAGVSTLGMIAQVAIDIAARRISGNS